MKQRRLPTKKLCVGIHAQMFPCNFPSFGILLSLANGLCVSVIVQSVGMCERPWGCEAVGLFQWKRFTAAPVCHCSLSLHKTQQDSNMDLHTPTHTLIHLHRCTVTYNKVCDSSGGTQNTACHNQQDENLQNSSLILKTKSTCGATYFVPECCLILSFSCMSQYALWHTVPFFLDFWSQ